MTVTELPRHSTDEPPASSDRWVPTRAGILNVWRYYDEVFEFYKGRLLLRGPNGTGKSKALELLLPFLFDANLRANRLSTFGTSERTMHWNLMGEGASGTTRVGYVWLEFGFAGRWFCCGARLQASTHTTTVHADYFTTELRIGEPDGLALVNDMGQPLTRSALEERLGDRGVVHGNAGDYRADVRSTLFPGLSEQRYDALITALLQLRTPKLSQRLDPALLSTLLSKALPPLGQQEIADLAEGFERLDAQRERLAALAQEVTATRTLAARQRTYAQRVLRAGAAKLISATSELDKLTRVARQSAEEYDEVALHQTATRTRSRELTQELADADARRTGLIDSEAYKKGQELDRLREQTAAAATTANRIRADAARMRATAEADELASHQARQRVRTLSDAVRTQETEVRHAAARAGLASVHEELAAGLATNAQQVRPLLRAAVRSRQEQLAAVGRALNRHERAVDRRGQAEADLDLARTALSTAEDALRAATGRRELALTELGSQLTEWARDCRVLVFHDHSSLLDHVESEPALLAVVDRAAADVAHQITAAETTSASALRTARAERDGLVAELNDVTADRDLPPAAPPTRTTDRTTMPGAPLWRLVDFAAATPEDSHAGIEAALEASGLLDAWLGARGDIPGHDVFADPSALAPVRGRSLADVLVPEQGADVAADVVRRLLAAVALGDRLPADGQAAIGIDGTWRMGNLTGSWHKDQAAHIGAAARERSRERRARELRALIADRAARINSYELELAALRARRDVLANERAAHPSHAVVDDATRELTRAESDLAASENVVRQRLSGVTEREREVTGALRDLTALAAVVDGLRVGAAELLDILRGEADQSRHEITDRERELFDQTLTGDTRRHLAARIRQANELVDGMNARLEQVRTASKVAVRLVWQIAPDLPAGTKTARDLLLRDPVRLTDADRESLHRFFRDRIEQARTNDTAASWEQQLAQVFDYTAWHQFVVKVDRANGAGWQLLTRRLHGALSGGEKAIALHLPLFAAVAAHYEAVPAAPRVILLDEVFVGVDTTNRGQVFALLSALDLDLMLTSDHEWCTYAELDGVGIHQLITGADGDDAVTTARFTWNGQRLLASEPL